MKKTALITGGNRGIGLSIAKLFAQNNINVIIACRNPQNAEKILVAHNENHDEKIKIEKIDLEKINELKTQIDYIVSNNPQIDILVNNAAILQSGNFNEISEMQLRKSMQVNFFAHFTITRAVLENMKLNKYGRIINLSSGWGSFNEGLNGPVCYSVSKAALNALTLSASHAMPEYVKVNAMCPGWTKTRMGGEDAPREPEQAAQTALFLANLPDNAPTGGFFRDKIQIKW